MSNLDVFLIMRYIQIGRTIYFIVMIHCEHLLILSLNYSDKLYPRTQKKS